MAAARAAGIDPIDVGHSTYADLDGTSRTAEISAQMGFTGSVVLSPRQIPIVNAAFSPAPEDIAWASQVPGLFEAEGAKKEAGTVVVVDGDMIDGPFVVNGISSIDATKSRRSRNGSRAATRSTGCWHKSCVHSGVDADSVQVSGLWPVVVAPPRILCHGANAICTHGPCHGWSLRWRDAATSRRRAKGII